MGDVMMQGDVEGECLAEGLQDLRDMGFGDEVLSRQVLSRCQGNVKVAVKRLMQLERRGGQECSLASLLSYGAVQRLKGDGVSNEAMDAIMAIEVEEVTKVSVAVGNLLQFFKAVALKEPPS